MCEEDNPVGEPQKKPTPTEKIVLDWSDSRVNGSVAAMIAVAFGAFGILSLYDGQVLTLTPIFPTNMWKWVFLTIGYGLVGVIGFYFYSRAVAYSTMANLKGGEFGVNKMFNELKSEINKGTTLSRPFQKTSLWAINRRGFIFWIVVALYFISWFAVALQI